MRWPAHLFLRPGSGEARRLLWGMLVAMCVAAQFGCTDDGEGDGARMKSSSSTKRAEESDGDHIPGDVYMRRLGAVDGAVWTGRVAGTRIIMQLGRGVDEDGDAYVAAIRVGEPTRVFQVARFSVNREGEFYMMLAPVGRYYDSGTVDVYGVVRDGVFDLEETVNDADSVIPLGLKLQRCSGKVDEDEAQLRKALEKIVKGRD